MATMHNHDHDHDLSVTVKISNGLPQCRARWLGNHDIEKGQRYIVIHGWSANGLTNLCLCEKHTRKFFEQVDTVKRELGA